MLIWCDTETTGLDPRKGALLEVALVVTTNDLEEVAAKSWVLPYDFNTDTALTIDPFVREMHTKNGLWIECSRMQERIGEGLVEAYPANQIAEMVAFARRYTEPKSGPICGSTVSFDRAWLEVHAPDLAAHFSHRHLDVSVFTEMAVRMYPEAHAGRPKGAGHRALPDIRVSIDLLRYWRSTVLR